MVYLLGLDAVQCCREANTSCTPNSDRTGRLESTWERTSCFQSQSLGFGNLLTHPAHRLAGFCSQQTSPPEVRAAWATSNTRTDSSFIQVSETSQAHIVKKPKTQLSSKKRFIIGPRTLVDSRRGKMSHSHCTGEKPQCLQPKAVTI